MDIELLSIKSFTERFGISRSATYKEIGARRLIARKVGKLTRISIEDARAWAEALPRL